MPGLLSVEGAHTSLGLVLGIVYGGQKVSLDPGLLTS